MERLNAKIRTQLNPYWHLIERLKAGENVEPFIKMIEENQAKLLELVDKAGELEEFWLESVANNIRDKVISDKEFLMQVPEETVEEVSLDYKRENKTHMCRLCGKTLISKKDLCNHCKISEKSNLKIEDQANELYNFLNK